MNPIWQIKLFGKLQVESSWHTITHFRTEKTGSILAYLAYYRQRPHLREKLVDLFWPDASLAAGRNSLRVALNSLRRQLETPATPAETILLSNRTDVQLNPVLCHVDSAEFEIALDEAGKANSLDRRMVYLSKAVHLYQGELLADYYDDWVENERKRLADRYLEALHRLSEDLLKIGEFHQALNYAHRALHADPLCEDSHCYLIRLYVAVGRPAAASNQYQALERLLEENLSCRPSHKTRALFKNLLAS